MTENVTIADMKREFRWALNIDGIPSYLAVSTHRPIMCRSHEGEIHSGYLSVCFRDDYVSNISHILWNWFHLKEKKKAVLFLYNPEGLVVEEWKFEGLFVSSVSFGELSYQNTDAIEITLNATYDKVELV